MNSIKKKTKIYKNIDSDEDNLIEELEAYSALSNHKDVSSKKSTKNIKKQDSSSDSESSSEDDKKKKKTVTKKPLAKKVVEKKPGAKKLNPIINTEEETSEKNNKKKTIQKKKSTKKISDSDEDSEDDGVGTKTNINDTTLINAVTKWVQADNKQREIRKANLAKKKENDKLNMAKKETLPIITKKMAEDEMPKITITKGKLLLNKTSTKEKITEELVEEVLSKKLPKKKVDEIMIAIENEKEEIIKYNIKRVSEV
jgi:hypothetical protein